MKSDYEIVTSTLCPECYQEGRFHNLKLLVTSFPDLVYCPYCDFEINKEKFFEMDTERFWTNAVYRQQW